MISKGSGRKDLRKKILGIRGIRMEELGNAILNSTQNIQQDVPNKKHGF
jgi:hypothetical protein